MKNYRLYNYVAIVFLTVVVLLASVYTVCAQLTVNILAVNGSNKEKTKEIVHHLPSELVAADILDDGGLKLDYDVTAGTYYVHGDITLGPKETKTFKVRVRDVWQVDDQLVNGVREQIDASVSPVKYQEEVF